MITAWPRYSATLRASARPTMSVPPPGAKPTTHLIGLFGQPCACAALASMMAAQAATAPSTRANRLDHCMMPPVVLPRVDERRIAVVQAAFERARVLYQFAHAGQRERERLFARADAAPRTARAVDFG